MAMVTKESRMDPRNQKEGFELEIQIEELEPKVAPDGGETVLPIHGNGNGGGFSAHGLRVH